VRVVALALAFTAVLNAQTAPPFRTGVDAVRVDVLVSDGNRPIAGLTAQDFELFDNKVAQKIEAVAIEDLPISMMLALDTSYSVRGAALEDLKQAATAALGPLDARDRVALVTFSAEIAVRADWTADRQLVARAMAATAAGGGTALWDAAYAAMTLRDDLPDRRSLVLMFSDGDDTASWLPHSVVLDRAKRTDAVVYGITVGENKAPSTALMYRSGIELTKSDGPLTDPLLSQLADITGGQSFQAANTGRLAGAFTRIVKEFRTRYLLTYSPRDVSASGWHTLDVKLKNRRGQVRTRRGYLR
jgi:Ca-activated chloride channel family protein